MNWVEALIAQRDVFSQALRNETIYPNMNWPQGQAHYVQQIGEISRILREAGVPVVDVDQLFPEGRFARAVSL